MYGCTVETKFMGAAGSVVCDEELVDKTVKILSGVDGVDEIIRSADFGGGVPPVAGELDAPVADLRRVGERPGQSDGVGVLVEGVELEGDLRSSVDVGEPRFASS